MKRIGTTSILIALLVCTAASQNLPTSLKSAADLVEMCKDVDSNKVMREPALGVAYGFCAGYFNGLIAANTLVNYSKGADAALFCPPAGVTPDQARKVFMKYMTEHPEKLHEDGGSLAMISLMLAFPCAKAPTR